MTAKNFDKIKNQLEKKPAKWAKYVKHNKPKDKNFGKTKQKCIFSGTTRGVIRKYGINICRRYFKENSKKIGFKRFN